MDFDVFYSSTETYFSESHSEGMEECLGKYNISVCTALDIGAGEGRNALYLAANGFEVIAIEPSNVGVTKILERAKQRDVKITVIKSDFLSVSKTLHDIEFVLLSTVLEHMDYEYMKKAICEIKRIMKVGGYIYIVSFTEEDPGFKKDLSNASECSLFIKHYFKKGELKQLFNDFEILEYSEYLKEDTTHGPVHCHGKVKLFARKVK